MHICHILHIAVCKICIICCNIPDCILCIFYIHILLASSSIFIAYSVFVLHILHILLHILHVSVHILHACYAVLWECSTEHMLFGLNKLQCFVAIHMRQAWAASMQQLCHRLTIKMGPVTVRATAPVNMQNMSNMQIMHKMNVKTYLLKIHCPIVMQRDFCNISWTVVGWKISTWNADLAWTGMITMPSERVQNSKIKSRPAPRQWEHTRPWQQL